MTSLPSFNINDVPSESKCKHIVLRIANKGIDGCYYCNSRVAFKKNVDYGWCSKCRCKVRPKSITWLRNSKLSYRQIFTLLVSWQNKQSAGAVRVFTGLSYTTIQRWYNKFRENLPEESKDDDSFKLHDLVATDESWFGKRKFGNQKIVIGAIEVATRRLRLQIIPNTEQCTVEDFLENVIQYGSHIITDCSPSYNGISMLGFSREAYNHSIGHFEKSNNIECIWSSIKRHMRKMYGSIPTKYLPLILIEWEARFNHKDLFASPVNYLERCLVPF